MYAHERKCIVDACDNHQYSGGKGWCQKHLGRWKRYGDPSIVYRRHEGSTDPVPDGQNCRKCNLFKPFSDFSKSQHHTMGVRTICRLCVNENSRLVITPNRNKEKHNQKLYEWRRNNPERYRNSLIRSYEKERQSPVHRISHSITACIVQSIRKGSKASRKTIDLLGYSYETLKIHLERQFLPGMSWENYGRHGWHIDHIVPVASFSYETPDDPEFRVCWALTNLRPLWAKDNLVKCDKVLYLL